MQDWCLPHQHQQEQRQRRQQRQQSNSSRQHYVWRSPQSLGECSCLTQDVCCIKWDPCFARRCPGGVISPTLTPTKNDCGAGMTTIGKRSLSTASCINLPGYAFVPDSEGNPTAQPCPPDTWNTGMRRQRTCYPCPLGYTTNGVGGNDALSDCGELPPDSTAAQQDGLPVHAALCRDFCPPAPSVCWGQHGSLSELQVGAATGLLLQYVCLCLCLCVLLCVLLCLQLCRRDHTCSFLQSCPCALPASGRVR